ncbi:hypothetical protein MN116_009027 [Schistosoma mekongi]|uniref:Uncharacterized protein n=1 Tax=Schistosoma mekongi TaxID=38744 RepID=A0AAE1Z5E8_SCHME|nr:hypothetical protein MN116_009027 [Schistosoma mekongi]
MFLIPFIDTDEIKINADVKSCTNQSVYYISVKNDTNTLWYLISASQYHPPSLILIQTTAISQFTVNCSAFTSDNALMYKNSIFIICYNDTTNNAMAPYDETGQKTFLGSNLNWSLVTFNNASHDFINIEFQAIHSADSHDKINGAIKLNFKVYRNRERPYTPLYYRTENALTIIVELTLDNVEVNNAVNRFSPVLLIFSNHSLEDDEYFLNKEAVQIDAEDGPLGKLKSVFIQLGTRVKNINQIQYTLPNAYLQLPPAYWINKQQTEAQLVRIGRINLIDKQIIKSRTYHFSLPLAFYGDRFQQIHNYSTVNHVAIREQIINLGSPHSKYYIDTNYSTWTMILGLGDPNIIFEPSNNDDDDDDNNNRKKSIISSITCGLLIVIGVIISVYIKRRIEHRHYQRIIPVLNNNSTYTNINNDSTMITSMPLPSSMNDNAIVEPFHMKNYQFIQQFIIFILLMKTAIYKINVLVI